MIDTWTSRASVAVRTLFADPSAGWRAASGRGPRCGISRCRGFDRLLELRWALRVRRAPVMSPEEHAAAVADPERRHSAIEVPIACAACGGRRLQQLLHVYDHRHTTPRWNYHVVRCAELRIPVPAPGHPPGAARASCTPPGSTPSSSPASTPIGGSSATRSRWRRSARCSSRATGRRLLDFGCGNGLFLDIAHERGFECFGVDLAADAVEGRAAEAERQHVYHGAPDDDPRDRRRRVSTSSRCGRSWPTSPSRSRT